MTSHFYAFSRLRDKAGKKILRRREFTITFAGVEINRKVRAKRAAQGKRMGGLDAGCSFLAARNQ
jgi:hypothetical protein